MTGTAVPAEEPGEKPKAKPVRNVRIRFRKFGAMLYISHLDLSKTVMRSILRSRLPVYYSEGFNPIPKLVFSPPLSVGIGGENEALDIKLMEAVPNAEIMSSLSGVMPAGIEIVRIYEQKEKLTEIKWAENTIEYLGVSAGPDVLERMETVFSGPVIMVKRSKSGEKETDISPLVRSVTAESRDGRIIIKTVTSASGERYLNAEYVARALEERFREVLGPEPVRLVYRTRFFKEDGVTEWN